MSIDLEQFAKDCKGIEIIYVEDSDDIRESTRLLLNNFFDDVEVACDGRDGLNKYNEFYKQNNKYFDIVITDINMPNMDGIEMSEAIYKINKDQHIIVITAFNDSEMMKKLIEIGINNYLHKPIILQPLVSTLSKTISSYRKQQIHNIHINEIKKLNNDLDAMVENFDTYVIASRTDLKGIITYASKSYEAISGYTEKELIGRPHSIVRHPDMKKEIFQDMWNTIQDKKLWIGEIKNLRKDGSYYWVEATIAPYYDNEHNHIGYSSIRIDITNKKKAEQISNRMNDLLNNAEEGFLSFDRGLKCGYSFSKECLNIFNIDNIHNEDISYLLFSDNANDDNKQLFLNGCKNIFNSNDNLTKELMLSLLPKERVINNKVVSIKYKILQENRIMMILTNITEKKELEQQIEQHNKIQKMIVSVASNKDNFRELKESYEDFLLNKGLNTKNLLRELHTFKGIFLQKDLIYTPSYINNLETKINNSIKVDKINFDKVLQIFDDAKLMEIFAKDISLIKNILGNNIFDETKSQGVDKALLNNINLDIKQILNSEDPNYKEKLRQILNNFDKLIYESLHNMLSPYIQIVKKIALRLNKEICPLEIQGNEDIMVSSRFKPFIQSLTHLFNNCIDHGIEDATERINKGKDEIGTVKCNISEFDIFGLDNISNSMVRLEISDDGAGIDVNKLIEKAIQNGIMSYEESLNLSEKEKLDLIFVDNITTKEKQTIVSGRGVGMSALKHELDKLDGKVEIQNNYGKGVAFIFILPKIKREAIVVNKSNNINENSISISNEGVVLDHIVKQTELFIENNSDLEIIDSYYCDKITIFDKISAIQLEKNNYNAIIIYNFEKNVVNSIADKFLPSDFSEDDMIAMKDELPKEIANIAIGLALSSFPKEVHGVELLPSLTLTRDDVYEYINNSKTYLIKQINTTKGKILCTIIKLGE